MELRQALFLALVLALGASLTAAASDVVVVVTTVTVGPTIPSNEPEWKDGDTFTSAILNSTNFYRGEHNATDLTWNKTLEDFADDYLDDIDCAFEHSGGPYGENLAIGYPNTTASVEAWGDERDEYNFKAGKFSEETGHFTQLVWKTTTDVGCGRKLCGDRGWYLVCEYWPRGNIIGEFKEEVQAEEDGADAGNGASAEAVIPRAGFALAAVLSIVLIWA